MTLNPKASSCSHGPEARPKFEWKDAAQRRGYGFGDQTQPLQQTKTSKRDGSVTDSLFGGLGVKRFSHLLIEGVAFAFGCEAFVFRLNIGFALL